MSYRDRSQTMPFVVVPSYAPEPDVMPPPPAPVAIAPGRLLLTIEEAAARLMLGRSTVYALVAAGHVESVHVGRACRIPAAALDDFVANLRGLGCPPSGQGEPAP